MLKGMVNKINKDHSLAETHPMVAKLWHPVKNGNLTPYDVTSGSGKIVWWKCQKAEDHEWKARVSDCAKKGQGCSCCAGRTVVSSNCLSVLYPDIAKQWHPVKNGNLFPHMVTAYSNKSVWWKCLVGNDHEWQTKINTRTGLKRGCPYCAHRKASSSYNLTVTHPHISEQWHPTKNEGKHPANFVPGSHEPIWWKCPVAEDHEWRASINTRTRGRSCPFCSGQKVSMSNSLSVTYPHLKFQWDTTKNNIAPEEVTFGSGKLVWWKCCKGHVWRASVANRTIRKSGCPYCCESKSELFIADILMKHQINFEREYSFDTCRNILPLRFDFAIIDCGGLKLIEYQGEQHYRPVTFGSETKTAEEMFCIIKKRDNIKRNWCSVEGIPLLIIPYYKSKEIEELIVRFLGI